MKDLLAQHYSIHDITDIEPAHGYSGSQTFVITTRENCKYVLKNTLTFTNFQEAVDHLHLIQAITQTHQGLLPAIQSTTSGQPCVGHNERMIYLMDWIPGDEGYLTQDTLKRLAAVLRQLHYLQPVNKPKGITHEWLIEQAHKVNGNLLDPGLVRDCFAGWPQGFCHGEPTQFIDDGTTLTLIDIDEAGVTSTLLDIAAVAFRCALATGATYNHLFETFLDTYNPKLARQRRSDINIGAAVYALAYANFADTAQRIRLAQKFLDSRPD